MNRKIIFRAKRIDNGEWVEGNLLHDPDLDIFSIVGFNYYNGENGLEREEFCYSVDPATVGQYTGLTDKNGVKIFEGDVVKLSYVDENDDELTGDWFAIVEFGNPNGEYNWGFQLRPISECRWNCEILLWVDMEETGAYCEVIGNIHNT